MQDHMEDPVPMEWDTSVGEGGRLGDLDWELWMTGILILTLPVLFVISMIW